MKIKLLAIVSLLFFFSSCNKDDVSGSDSYFFKVKVDGKLVEATGTMVYAVQDSDDFNIYGIFSNKSSMYLQLAAAKGVGTHQIVENPNFAFFTSEAEVGHRSDYNGVSGEVTITEKSSTIVKGTFKCTVKESNQATKIITLSEGEFSVKFR